MPSPRARLRELLKRTLILSSLALLAAAFLPGLASAEEKQLHLQDLSVHKIDLGNSPAVGPENAKVTVIEFMDYSCPFCVKVEPAFHKVMLANQDKVRFVIKHHWLAAHKNARLAAQVSMAANLQQKFWPVHELLLTRRFAASPKGATIDGYLEYLKGIPGLDLAKLKADVDSPEVNTAVDADLKFKSPSTPEFLFNGHLFTGELTEAQLQQFINEAAQP